MENVPGILTIGGGAILDEIYEALQNLGYNCRSKILYAEDFGSPQQRRRVFFIATRYTWSDSLFPPGIKVAIIEGSLRKRKEALARSSEPIVIVNYESARNEITAISAVLRKNRCVLLLDESHAVKNPSTLNSIAARSFSPFAEYRWLLSGTPVTNRPSDIRSQIEVIDPSHSLGSRELFDLEFGDANYNSTRRKQLNDRVGRYVLRRTKKECLDLPPKTFTDIYVSLPDWQRSLYDNIRQGLIDEIKGMTDQEYRRFTSINALTRLLRLSQVASNPALVFANEKRTPAKFEELDRLITVAADNTKIIIWSSYVPTIKALTIRYASRGIVTLYGEVPPQQRQSIANSFQRDKEVRILIANPAAAGSGFTLTAATLAVYESLNWRYDVYAQSQDRNHRIGQKQPVRCVRLIAKNTVEEAIVSALERKNRMAHEIISGSFTAEPISNLSRQEFCRIFLSDASELRSECQREL
jgi:SNF2 family DNA or RNA helicase